MPVGEIDDHGANALALDSRTPPQDSGEERQFDPARELGQLHRLRLAGQNLDDRKTALDRVDRHGCLVIGGRFPRAIMKN